MGIAAKHAYRFGYLKGEKWQNFRLSMLVKFNGRCLVCGLKSFYLDVHHIWYPKKLNDVCVGDVRVLCRACHDKAHLATEPKAYKDRHSARKAFQNFLVLAKQGTLEQSGIFTGCRRLKKSIEKQKPSLPARKKCPPTEFNIILWSNQVRKEKIMRLLTMIFHGDNPPICEERRDFLQKWLDWNHLTAL